jgi:hypothetical protein
MLRRSPTARCALVAALSLAAGLLVGVRLGRRTSPPGEKPGPPVAQVGTPPAATTPGQGQETRAVVTAEPEPPPAPLSRLRAIAELNRARPMRISVPPVQFGQLNEDFAAVFELSPAEAQRLRASIAATRARLDALEASHAQIVAEGNGRFTVTVPPFPEEGGAVHDDFVAALRGLLGEERWSYYTRISEADFEQSSEFGGFGLTQSVFHVRTGQDGPGHPSLSSSGSRQDSGTWTREINGDLELFRNQYPLLYEKMRAGGYVPAAP